MNAIPMLSSQPWVERLGWTLVHFLWQGLSLAVLYAGARRATMRASAHARYLLACAALAAMMAAPAATWVAMRPPSAPPQAAQHVRRALRRGIVAASLPDAARIAIPSGQSAEFLPWVVAVWLAGVTVFWVRLASGWIVAARLRSRFVRGAPAEWQRRMERLGARIGLVRPVRLLVSSLVDAPAVIGWLRPMVLVPVGMLAGLAPEQVEMLLLHELAHIRRYDYLVNILQSVAEALLFYNPAVWWVSGHIRAERELCCDDVAVSADGDVLTYARALAELEGSRPVRVRTALAANGGSLADRIARLLGQTRPAARTGLGPSFVTVAVLLAPAVYGSWCAAWAQQPPAPLSFDAASVKVDRSYGPGHSSHDRGGLLTMTNVTLKLCIQTAYGVPQNHILGPAWLDSETYDITAKAAADAVNNQFPLRLQTLLKERFHLALHREMREGPIYQLVATKNISKMKKEASAEVLHSGIDSDRLGHVTFTAVDMPTLVDWLQRPRLSLGRPVVDKTGLDGYYSFNLDWVVEAPPAMADAGPGPKTGDDAATAIIVALQEQAGLKLEPRKGPIEFIVVDHAAKVPTEN